MEDQKDLYTNEEFDIPDISPKNDRTIKKYIITIISTILALLVILVFYIFNTHKSIKGSSLLVINNETSINSEKSVDSESLGSAEMSADGENELGFMAVSEEYQGVDYPECIGFDVMIVAGQSNNIRGKFYDPKKDAFGERVYQIGRHDPNNMKIIPATNPLHHFVGRTVNEIGYINSFVRYYKDKNYLRADRCILIVPVAKGGTSFDSGYWMPRGEGALDLVERSQVALENKRNRIVAFFWQQGESDINLSKDDYKNKWNSMITFYKNNLRTFDHDTPILIGQMVPDYIDEKSPRLAEINRAHIELSQENNQVFFVKAEGLGENDEPEGEEQDTTHYSAASQRELGKRYFAKWANNADATRY